MPDTKPRKQRNLDKSPKLIPKLSTKSVMPKLHFKISGFEACPYFQNALISLKTFKNNAIAHTNSLSHNVVITIHTIQRVDWPNHLEKRCNEIVISHKPHALLHKSSPFISCNNHFVGGYDKLIVELQNSKPFDKYLHKLER